MRATTLIATCLMFSNLACFKAQAANPIWQASPTPLAVQLNDYKSTQCSQPTPTPHTGHLRLDSKYDQTDASRSTLSNNSNREAQLIQDQINAFYIGLVRIISAYEKAKTAPQAKEALSCFDQWLETWARAGALQSTDSSPTGQAVRKWALAALSASAMKMQILSGQRYSPSSIQRNWLERLASLVISDYQPRLNPSYQGFNNHDYWAAWAVAATGMLLNRDSMIAWADQGLRRGLSQIVLSTPRDYAYLPLEAGRGSLGADYTHYALVPLVLLAETAQRNGRPLNAQEQQKLELLAVFAARAALEPSRLPELQGKQSTVASYKMAWLIPFLQNRPSHSWATRLYQSQAGNVDNYSQLGGAIKPFYPRVR